MQSSLLQEVSRLCDEKQYEEMSGKISMHFGLSSADRARIDVFLEGLEKGRTDASSSIMDIKLDASEAALLQARFAEKPLSSLGTEIDFLGASVPENLATILIYVANRLVPRTGKAAVVTSVRNEGPWVLEWIAHYKALGVGLIVIVHNDSDDGTNEILDYLSARGEIVAIRNNVASSVSPQRKGFNSVLHLVPEIHAYEWVSFLDADEFLVPLSNPAASMSDVIDDIETRARQGGSTGVDAILLHWRWFSSPRQYLWEPGSTTARFTLAAENEHVKSIARTRYVWSMSRLHVPALIRSGVAVDSTGHEVSLSEQLKPPRYGVAQINHYFAKSFQEFVLKKARGRGAVGLAGPARDFDNFLWGSHHLTSEKRDFPGTELKLRAMLEDAVLAKLNSDSAELARQRIIKLQDEKDLRRLHAELTKYVKSTLAGD